jgi:hypothetical protein
MTEDASPPTDFTAARGTWLSSEAACGTRNGYKRKGQALMPDGSLRAVRAKLPDTTGTVPAYITAHGRRQHGYLTYEYGCWLFHPEVPL